MSRQISRNNNPAPESEMIHWVSPYSLYLGKIKYSLTWLRAMSLRGAAGRLLRTLSLSRTTTTAMALP